MRIVGMLVVIAACGHSPAMMAGDASGGDDDDGGASSDGSAAMPSDGLIVSGNMIVHTDGTRFHGRGADLHDVRSCEACSYMPADPDGLDRWSDELCDTWHANFVRFVLSAKAAPAQYEVQWQDLNDDAAYLADIQQNVTHMTAKPGVYVLVTLFEDPTIKPNDSDYDSEFPSSLGDSTPRYQTLAETFVDNPRVLFGLTNEPHTDTTAHEADLAAQYQTDIATIRAVEDAHHAAHHIVVAQAPLGYARDLTYFLANPLVGDQIAYEIHPYNPQTDFDSLIVQPSQTLPVIIGEYGPAGTMTTADVEALWTVAEQNQVPYIAWNFHQRCPPNLLMDTASDGCGLAASTGYDFPRTDYGDMLYTHLQTPW